MTKRVCVIGGGISGLCVTHRLKLAGVDVVLFEKTSSVGGNIKTDIIDGFLVEHGPNSTLANRELLDLINELGISDEIQPPNSGSKNRYILLNGELVRLPARIIELIGNRALTLRAKLRLLKEPFVRTKSLSGETVAAFFERRFGKEIVDRLLDPFVSGIYAGDPHKLSVEYAFPRLVELERDFGSVLIGAVVSRPSKEMRLPKGTPRSLTFKKGMQTLVDTLYENSRDSIRLGASVTDIMRSGPARFRVAGADAEEEFDAVVVCTPAHHAAEIVRDIDDKLAQELSDVYYPPISVVFTALRSEQVKIDTRGFGFLVPAAEKRDILGSLWTSSVFPGRTPKDGDWHLFTTFIGGSRNAALANAEDEEAIATAVEELRSIIGINGHPEFVMIKKWEKAIPQYNLGYERVHHAIDTFRKVNPGIFFCSNFYKGISVADCVKNATATTKEVLDLLKS